uniref:ORF149 n=1 Tax=Spodoptera frugiperda granulovirus TaxID=307454 RepID=A0A346QW69_9BBAC|nr:ORF149 [Spodoptera frugiperda granulovirus]
MSTTNSLLSLSFNKCMDNNLQVYDVIPSCIVNELLEDYMIAHNKFKAFVERLINFAHKTGHYGQVLRFVLNTTVCKRLVFAIMDDYRVFDITVTNERRWTFEEVLSVIVFTKFRYCFASPYKMCLLSYNNFTKVKQLKRGDLCRFCVKTHVCNRRLVKILTIFQRQKHMLKLENYCSVCYTPLFEITQEHNLEFYCSVCLTPLFIQ